MLRDEYFGSGKRISRGSKLLGALINTGRSRFGHLLFEMRGTPETSPC